MVMRRINTGMMPVVRAVTTRRCGGDTGFPYLSEPPSRPHSRTSPTSLGFLHGPIRSKNSILELIAPTQCVRANETTAGNMF
jgi:hypothetical protein